MVGISARRVCVESFERIVKHGETVEQALLHDSILDNWSRLSIEDRGFCYHLLLLSLRYYDRAYGFGESLMVKRAKFKRGDRVALVMVMGLVQLCMLDTPLYAVIAESHKLLALGWQRRYRSFIEAILRKGNKRRSEFMTMGRGSLWLERWQNNYGVERGNELWGAIYETPHLDLVFKDGVGCDRFVEAFSSGVSGTSSADVIFRLGERLRLGNAGMVSDLPFYGSGDWWVQDIASGLAVELLGDVGGERVLDLCAAPGGKTLQLLVGGADVVAVDKSEVRLKLLRDNLRRLDLCCEIVCGDIFALDVGVIGGEFSHIVLDAPCSASGTLRHNPELALIKSPDIVEDFAKVQLALLSHVYDKFLASGGCLMYSVCSLEFEEGEEVLRQFLALHGDARIRRLDGDILEQVPHERSEDSYIRTYPSDWLEQGRLDGFFLCCVVKP